MAFFRSPFAQRQQPAQTRIPAAIDHVHEQIGRAVGESQPCADDEFRRMAALFGYLFGGVESSDNPGQGIDVGDGDGFVTQFGGAVD